MTKEKIWQLQRAALHPMNDITAAVYPSMEEYAKQVAIEFKEWQDVNLEDKNWENYDGHDTWINPHTRQVISTSQLYEIFKSQQ